MSDSFHLPPPPGTGPTRGVGKCYVQAPWGGYPDCGASLASVTQLIWACKEIRWFVFFCENEDYAWVNKTIRHLTIRHLLPIQFDILLHRKDVAFCSIALLSVLTIYSWDLYVCLPTYLPINLQQQTNDTLQSHTNWHAYNSHIDQSINQAIYLCMYT